MSYLTKVRRLLAVALLASMVTNPPQAFAADMSGIHAFFNDDQNQFVDAWDNSNGQITIKASNGRPWRPMWVVVHATFMSGGQVVGKKDYHVFCGSPVPGGHGNERWFHYGNPGFGVITGLTVTTNKEAPWGSPKGGWEVEVSTSGSF
jgi:hypothetical protein